MTPCEERGWKIGDRFVAIADNVFSSGSIVELYEDDGSDIPLFKLVEGECRYNHAAGPGGYVSLEFVEPIGESQ